MAVALLLEPLAERAAGLLGNFHDLAIQTALAQSLRLIAPAVLFFGLSGSVTRLLYRMTAQ